MGLSTDLALVLHLEVLVLEWQALRTLVFIREILVEKFGLIFLSEMFLKSYKMSWPVCPFMSINSVNKSMYQRVCFQSG